MSRTLLKTTVIGNVGKARVIGEDKPKEDQFISVTVAVDSPIKGEPPEWVELVMGPKYLSLMPYLIPGKCVYAEGRSRVQKFNRNDGSSDFVTKIRVSDINLL